MLDLTRTILEINENERKENRFVSLDDLRNSVEKCRKVFGPKCRTIVTASGMLVFTTFNEGTVIPRHYHDFVESILITHGELEEVGTGKIITRYATIPPYTYHAFIAKTATGAVINCSPKSISMGEVMELAHMFNYLQK